jgi:hypothetical protein
MRTHDCPLRSLLACCTASAALLLAGSALAAGVAPNDATPAQKKQATEHFTAGKQALESKNWEKAILELRSSLDVVDSPNARLELARALRESGSLPDAFAEYGRVVEGARKLAATEERYAKTAEAATSERAEMESKLAFVVVTLTHAPGDAVLKVGGRTVPPAEAAAPVVVPAGAVDVVLSDATGKEIARQTVNSSAGQKTQVALDAQPAVPPPPRDTKVDPDDKPPVDHPAADVVPPSSGASKLRPYAYIAGGVGVAGLAMFTIFGVMDNSTYSDLQSKCPLPATASTGRCPPGSQSEIDSGRTQQTLANVGLVVGAVGVAAGATLFVLSLNKSSSPTAPSTGLVVAPGYLGLRGSM